MTLYKFKTFRTSYYFPAYSKEREILYSLYAPLGRRKLAKWVWWAFKHVAPFRWLMRCGNPDAEFPYNKIMALCPQGSTMSFNMGTPSEEQKISMLGLDDNGNRFFAKYSVLPVARQLSENEIQVLTTLKGLGIAPELYRSHITDEAIFFTTSCVDGKNPTDKTLNKDVWSLLDMLSKHHLATDRDFFGLKTCLSHGDFTPWNMMVENGRYRLIDWEMAAERPLGFDIFTYTLRQEILTLDKPASEIVKTHMADYNRYFAVFDIKDWTPYLRWYAEELCEKYNQLTELL